LERGGNVQAKVLGKVERKPKLVARSHPCFRLLFQ
jgi:hypothetical protein